MAKQILFRETTVLPAIGQGTWGMGEKPLQRLDEIHALQAGIDRGLRLIDTAEMYADGGAERIVGDAIAGRRDEIFLVSKVYPWNAGGHRAIAACEASLKRLQTDFLDLYLLHWRGDIPLEETLKAMQTLQQQGKIRRWGVSNFDNDDMQDLIALQGGKECATNQVLYHLASRGIEFDLLPWCQQQSMPVMAYCPLAQAGGLRDGLMDNPVLLNLAAQKQATVSQLLLAWLVSHPGVMAIPKAGSVHHVKENAAALDVALSKEEIAEMEKAFPAPGRKTPLDVV